MLPAKAFHERVGSFTRREAEDNEISIAAAERVASEASTEDVRIVVAGMIPGADNIGREKRDLMGICAVDARLR